MNAIAAAAANWGIGLDNQLLFHISEDLRRFRALTAGGTLVMGRKTLDSLPGGRPLPGRRCVILTRDPAFDRPGVETARSPEEALALTAGEDPDRVWLCGGGEVYALLLPFCRTCRLTRVFAAPPCDAFFPDLDRLEQWRAVRREAVRTEGGLSFQFIDFVNSAPAVPPASGHRSQADRRNDLPCRIY